MRWFTVQRPRHWECRERDGFLLMPKRADGEWRWLERAKWSEHFSDPEGDAGHWQADEWVDDEPRYKLTEAGRALLDGAK